MAVIPPGLDGSGTNQSIFGVYGCFEFLVARLHVGACEQSESDSKVEFCQCQDEGLIYVISLVKN